MNAATLQPSKTVTTSWLHFAPEEFTLSKRLTYEVEMTSDGMTPMRADSLICLIDPDEAIVKSVVRLFHAEKYPIEIFASVQSFLSRKPHDGPCCLIVDADLPGAGSFKLQQILNRDQRTEQIVFASGQRDVRMCAEALKAGAADFLTKPLKNNELLPAALGALLRSSKLWHQRKEMDAARALLDRLAPREREVLSHVIAGRINKEIAAEVGTTEKTIKKQRARLMIKLQVASVAEMVHFSLKSGVKPARPYGPKVPLNGAKCPLYKPAQIATFLQISNSLVAGKTSVLQS